jgi:predicted esterase
MASLILTSDAPKKLLTTRTLHVSGLDDKCVSPKFHRELCDCFIKHDHQDNNFLEIKDMKHRLPQKKKEFPPITDFFLSEMMEKVKNRQPLLHHPEEESTPNTNKKDENKENKGSSSESMTYKVLVLHGYGQNKEIIEEKMSKKKGRGLESFCRQQERKFEQLKNVKFHYVDAPHQLPPPLMVADVQGEKQEKTQQGEIKNTTNCTNCMESTTKSTDAILKRAWWTYSDKYDVEPNNEYNQKFIEDHEQEYNGWENSVELLKEEWKVHGPFDCIFGFSQGAVMAHSLCELSEQTPRRFPTIQSAVFVCGFPSRLARLNLHVKTKQ